MTGRRTAPFVAGALAAVLAVLVGVLLITSGQGHDGPSAASGPGPPSGAPAAPTADPKLPRVGLTVSSRSTLMAVPRAFLGLSTEYWTLPVVERHIALYRRVVSLLRVPGDGPFVLRIGGDSSDHTFYDPRILKLPSWVFALTPQFVSRTATIVRDMRLKVILDLNLVTATPQVAAEWAEEAQAQMPRGSIIGYEIGNEPDLYSRAFWRVTTIGGRFGSRVLPKDITPTSYARDFSHYARVLSSIAPHVPLLGPALANPFVNRRWISTLLAGSHPRLKVISGHRYPYSACAFPDSPAYPTIGRVLSEKASAGMASSLRPAVALARRAGLEFRLTELNSVTCGGLTGVSDTFATALWAPDAAFELLRTGVQGINVHARVYAINEPFSFDRQGLITRPLLYGLMLFARTLGPHARLVALQLHSRASLHLKAWAVRVGTGTLHLLLINKGATSVNVDADLPATAPASVERLLAPAPDSRSRVTLGGQQLNQNGSWEGRRSSETVTPRAHRYAVALPSFSAALLTVPIG